MPPLPQLRHNPRRLGKRRHILAHLCVRAARARMSAPCSNDSAILEILSRSMGTSAPALAPRSLLSRDRRACPPMASLDQGPGPPFGPADCPSLVLRLCRPMCGGGSALRTPSSDEWGYAPEFGA